MFVYLIGSLCSVLDGHCFTDEHSSGGPVDSASSHLISHCRREMPDLRAQGFVYRPGLVGHTSSHRSMLRASRLAAMDSKCQQDENMQSKLPSSGVEQPWHEQSYLTYQQESMASRRSHRQSQRPLGSSTTGPWRRRRIHRHRNRHHSTRL